MMYRDIYARKMRLDAIIAEYIFYFTIINSLRIHSSERAAMTEIKLDEIRFE